MEQEKADTVSLRLRVDRQTLWKISARGDRIAMRCSFDTRGFSSDCGRQALADRRPALLLHPANMSPARAEELHRKRQPVFMGTGPKRERELLVIALDDAAEHTHMYVQIKPDEWDQVVHTHTHTLTPTHTHTHTHTYMHEYTHTQA